ncbi:uncharacterized protein CC84DRAFT_1216081 [Paraphaeosphaeria sporulosa]|uniref:DUF6594 domain-containing protein n=1 Tax=Paraphaeosphaeria sporulosa TaxID=1460663 RepID=A0A177CJV8_9PLEO|nr:uncharacterized protein CC84DRAFT_1216081 [Paraphaeosphaeria sporulosa]OAG07077.1 hypothetical protein CC84DRAFT_1216081 [Paraphaeosphaeria sporulosa]
MNPPPNISDIELGRVRDGYPALAAWIARDPDGEAFVFRKFDRLAARNILHLQCRLIALEHEIDCLDEETRTKGDDESKQSLRRWETLITSSKDTARPENKRLAMLDELKGLLEEYYETILRQSQITNLKGPSGRVLETFRDYVDGRAFKHDASSAPTEDSIAPMRLISGRAKHFLEDKFDLVALRRGEEEDQLSRLLQHHWMFQERKTDDPFDRTTIYKHHHVVRTVAAISMTLAAILLIVAIISLYSVSNPKAKLGLVAMYTFLFAVSVALLTNARRAEVFAATAAYAAVLVVFVSGDIGGVKEEQCLVQLENGIFKMIRCPG